MAHLDLLDMAHPRSVVYSVDLEPRVEAPRYPVFERHVDAVRPLPPVTGDDGPGELPEEATVLAGEHSVRRVSEFRHPDHLRVRLRVLRRVEHEVEHFVRRDTSYDCRSFASNHRCPV